MHPNAFSLHIDIPPYKILNVFSSNGFNILNTYDYSEPSKKLVKAARTLH